MQEFTESSDFVKLKNFFIRKYTYCIDYDEILSLINYAVVEGHIKWERERSSFKTFIYKYVNWTFQKYITKETKHSHLGIVGDFSYEPLQSLELQDILELLPRGSRNLLYDRFILCLSMQELAKKYKMRIEKIKQSIDSAVLEAKSLVYNNSD